MDTKVILEGIVLAALARAQRVNHTIELEGVRYVIEGQTANLVAVGANCVYLLQPESRPDKWTLRVGAWADFEQAVLALDREGREFTTALVSGCNLPDLSWRIIMGKIPRVD